MSAGRTTYGNPPIKPNTPSQPSFTAGFDKINLTQVGFMGGLRSHILPEQIVKLEENAIKMAIVEARNYALTPEIDGLAARDFIVSGDFEDGNDNPIQMDHFRQPWSGSYTSTSGTFEVYKTNKDTDYDKKVYAIWGLRYVGTGPGRLGGVVSTSTVTFKDSAGNTYDVWECEGLDVHNEMYAWTPIIFNSSRQLRIFHHPKSVTGAYDTIQLIGKVIERRGDNVNGLQRPDVLSA